MSQAFSFTSCCWWRLSPSCTTWWQADEAGGQYSAWDNRAAGKGEQPAVELATDARRSMGACGRHKACLCRLVCQPVQSNTYLTYWYDLAIALWRTGG